MKMQPNDYYMVRLRNYGIYYQGLRVRDNGKGCIDKKFTSGLPLVFEKFFPDLLNFFEVFESTLFWSILSLKLSLILKTVLNIIIKLKKYCKGVFILSIR